jgi:hypothetical protein
MKKLAGLLVIFLALAVAVSGCRMFQSKETKAREEAKRQLQAEDWDTSDLPSLENPGEGVGFPEMGQKEPKKKMSKKVRK